MIPKRFFLIILCNECGLHIAFKVSHLWVCVEIFPALAWSAGLQYILLLHVMITLPHPLNPKNLPYSPSHLQTNSQTKSPIHLSLSLFLLCFPLFFSSIPSLTIIHQNGGSYSICVQSYNAIQEWQRRASRFMAFWVTFLLIHKASRRLGQVSNLCFFSAVLW